MKNIAERKTVQLSQRNVQPVVGRCCLQLKIESHTEAFAQRESPGFVDASTEGRVDHQLHPATLIEESLGNNCLLRRHRAQYRAALQDILNHLLRAGVVESAFFFSETDSPPSLRLRRPKSPPVRVPP